MIYLFDPMLIFILIKFWEISMKLNALFYRIVCWDIGSVSYNYFVTHLHAVADDTAMK